MAMTERDSLSDDSGKKDGNGIAVLPNEASISEKLKQPITDPELIKERDRILEDQLIMG